LEERGHLGVAWTRVVKDHEVDFERSHEDEDGDDDETKDACSPVLNLFTLRIRKGKRGVRVARI